MAPHGQTVPHDPPGVLKQRYVTAAAVLAWGAYAALVYVVLVRGLQLARDTAFPLTIGNIGTVERAEPINIWFPLFPVAFFLAALLPLATKYCIAFIVSIKGKDALSRWAKGILIVITLACIVSTLTATGPLMIESASGKYREAAVQGELVEARRDAEQANYDRMAESLKTMQTGTSVEAAAAREGVAGWSAKVAIAKKQLDAGQLPQARYDRIERASSAAAAREDLERKMQEQQVKIASLPTASTAVASVKSDESHGAQEFAEVSSAYWPLSAFFALEMIAVFFGLIELVLMLTRDRQLADWEAVHNQPTEQAGIDLRITDGTDQWQPTPQETTFDEEGNELVPVRRKKEVYYRKKGGKKKDDAQAPLNASDSRAPVANQVELQPNDLGADDVLRATADASGEVLDSNPTADLHSVDALQSEPFSDAERDAWIDRNLGSDLDDSSAEELTATRAAYESSFEGQGQDEVDEVGVQQEPEDHDTDPAETPLPNGEGVLIKAAE